MSAPFRFKQFEVNHHRSSMKVGVDAVLLGAWADVFGAERVLEVGCGCGVISLMLAQRNAQSTILAIDIHEESVGECGENFANSPWSNRLEVRLSDYCTPELDSDGQFDLILSNPPYFDSGIKLPDTPRLQARHQAGLSPESLLEYSKGRMTRRGRVAMIIPADRGSEIQEAAKALGYGVVRLLRMEGREGRGEKRHLFEFALGWNGKTSEERICLEDVSGEYTDAYRSLCRDFYLKF